MNQTRRIGTAYIPRGRRLTGCIAAALGLLVACGCTAEREAAPTAAAGKTRPKQHLVETAAVSSDPIGYSTVRNGTLQPRREVRVFNQEEGRIEALLHYEGDRVRHGDLLVRMDNKLLRAQLDKAIANRIQAEQDLGRLTKLRRDKLVSEDELTRAETAREVARAEETLLRTRLDYTTVRAPFDGTISARRAEPGDVVPRYSHLLTLIDTSSLITEVAVSGLLLPGLAVGDGVEIRIDALDDAAYEGRIERIHPTLDVATRRGLVEVGLSPVPAGALPGQLCRVTLRSPESRRQVVPFLALRRDAQGEHVFIVDSDGRAQRVPVRTGLRLADRVEITEGLSSGQQVIIKGFLGLAEGIPVRIVQQPRANSRPRADTAGQAARTGQGAD